MRSIWAYKDSGFKEQRKQTRLFQNDTYVKEEGKRLIQRRIANFMISDSRELGKIAQR